MSKKIGYFLMAMLVIWSVLLLMATGSRTAPQTQPTQPLQTVPGETEGTLPAPSTASTQPTETENTAFLRVKAVLDARKLNETACSHWVWSPELNAQGDVRGTAASSQGRALAQIAAERKMNPVAAFWALVSDGLYAKTEDSAPALAAEVFPVPEQAAKSYSYTEAGARVLVEELLALAGTMEDGLEMEALLLGADDAVEESQVSLAREEGCWYGYFITGGDCSTHILCFYLRSDGAGEQITDVEFQLLNLRSAQGEEQSLEVLDRRGDTQAAALMAAAELLLTGQTQANTGTVPASRQVGGYTATVERFHFTAEGETGTLTNYRLCKG